MTDNDKSNNDDQSDNDAEKLPTKSDGGYCNPPKSSQFQKGTSGNPKGRPPKSKNLKTDVNALLNEPMMVMVPGKKPKTVSTRMALLKHLKSLSIKKDNVKAAVTLLTYAQQFEPTEPDNDNAAPVQDELAIIKAHEDWLRARKKVP